MKPGLPEESPDLCKVIAGKIMESCSKYLPVVLRDDLAQDDQTTILTKRRTPP